MKSNKITVAGLKGEGKVICIVVSQWHKDITGNLLKGAKKLLASKGIKPKSIIVHEVPGSYELPLGAQWIIQKHRPDAVICLGCVIKGETPHFEFICNAVANGIMQLNIEHNIPLIFGVLTTNTLKQAKARSGGKHGNKGEEAAIAALNMLELRDKTRLEF